MHARRAAAARAPRVGAPTLLRRIHVISRAVGMSLSFAAIVSGNCLPGGCVAAHAFGSTFAASSSCTTLT